MAKIGSICKHGHEIKSVSDLVLRKNSRTKDCYHCYRDRLARKRKHGGDYPSHRYYWDGKCIHGHDVTAKAMFRGKPATRIVKIKRKDGSHTTRTICRHCVHINNQKYVRVRKEVFNVYRVHT